MRRLAVGAVVTVLAAAAAVALGAADAPSGGQTYLQFNLCGNVCTNGGLAVVTGLERSIHNGRPFAVTLNEVCENQYDRLRADLADYDGRFDPTGPTCRNGARYGNAILVRAADVTLAGTWELPRPAGDEARRLMCLDAASAPARRVTVCVTHISPHADNVGPQVSAVVGLVRALGDEHPVLLAGDFNTDPADARLDALYGPCRGAGLFAEVDSDGCAARSTMDLDVGVDIVNESTWQDRKFDYIFLSRDDWTDAQADATDPPDGLSDHDTLWATATPTATGGV